MTECSSKLFKRNNEHNMWRLSEDNPNINYKPNLENTTKQGANLS